MCKRLLTSWGYQQELSKVAPFKHYGSYVGTLSQLPPARHREHEERESMRREDHGQGFSPENPDSWNPVDECLPDELAEVVQWYESQPVPEPTSEALPQRVITRLQAEAMAPVRVSLRGRQPILQSLCMARWQFNLFAPSFWITGAMVLVLTAPNKT